MELFYSRGCLLSPPFSQFWAYCWFPAGGDLSTSLEFSSPGLVLYWIRTVLAFGCLSLKSFLYVFALGSVGSDDFL